MRSVRKILVPSLMRMVQFIWVIYSVTSYLGSCHAGNGSWCDLCLYAHGTAIMLRAEANGISPKLRMFKKNTFVILTVLA